MFKRMRRNHQRHQKLSERQKKTEKDLILKIQRRERQKTEKHLNLKTQRIEKLKTKDLRRDLLKHQRVQSLRAPRLISRIGRQSLLSRVRIDKHHQELKRMSLSLIPQRPRLVKMTPMNRRHKIILVQRIIMSLRPDQISMKTTSKPFIHMTLLMINICLKIPMNDFLMKHTMVLLKEVQIENLLPKRMLVESSKRMPKLRKS